MSPSSPTSFPLSVTFHSDWGVTTGTGVAGGGGSARRDSAIKMSHRPSNVQTDTSRTF